MRMNSSPSVSVVIASYKREQMLCQTLDRLLQQTYRDYEIIVVDQTLDHLPETQEYLDRLRSDSLIRYYLQRPSLPEARNTGVRKARGDIVIFLDDDVIPDPDLIGHHARTYEEPAVGGVAGQRIIPGLEEPLEPVGLIDGWGRHISNFSSTLPTYAEPVRFKLNASRFPRSS